MIAKNPASILLFFFLMLLATPMLFGADENKPEVPLTWQEHQRLATKLYDEGNTAGALSHFEKADLETDQPQVFHYNRGLCHRKLGEHEQALKQFKDAMGGQDPLLDMDAQFQVGMVHYGQALVESTDGGGIKLDIPQLTEASFAFTAVLDMGNRHKELLDGPRKDLLKKAETNVLIIATKYKDYQDKMSREKGKKSPIVQGDVKVNGRAVANTRVYIKSKWEDKIFAHTLCDAGGGFRFDHLKTGKYQLAAALFDTDKAQDLKWGEDVKVPAHEKDVQHLTVQGAITLASPYQTSCPSLGAPWDDHLRAGGSQSIVKSTDWGELNDGYPEASLPKDSDVNLAYVGFAEPEVQMMLVVPSQQGAAGGVACADSAGCANPAQGTPAVTPKAGGNVEAQKPPTFAVSLMGYHDGKTVVAPNKISISGLKEGLDKPMPLFEATITTTDAGLYRWTSEEFAHQDCRQLVLKMSRLANGQRMSLHEVEVSENLHQKKDDKDEQKQDDKKQDDKKQEQKQDQQKQDPKQDEQKQDQQKQEKQESRPTRAVLQKIRDKNKEAKEKQQASGMIFQTDKDY